MTDDYDPVYKDCRNAETGEIGVLIGHQDDKSIFMPYPAPEELYAVGPGGHYTRGPKKFYDILTDDEAAKFHNGELGYSVLRYDDKGPIADWYGPPEPKLLSDDRFRFTESAIRAWGEPL